MLQRIRRTLGGKPPGSDTKSFGAQDRGEDVVLVGQPSDLGVVAKRARAASAVIGQGLEWLDGDHRVASHQR